MRIVIPICEKCSHMAVPYTFTAHGIDASGREAYCRQEIGWRCVSVDCERRGTDITPLWADGELH